MKKITKDCIEWIQKFFEINGKGCNAVIGISGGKDSTIAAKLCAEALGKERVIGVMMPNGEQSDIDVSKKVIEYLGIKSFIVNIKDSVDGIVEQMKNNDIEITNQTMINLPARIRMSTLYAVSQSFNGRVVNTCNRSENYIGYSTRYGDAAGDFSPLGNLLVSKVKEIGYDLGIPKEFVNKVPSDGLCGKTDEDNLGFSYETLDKYILTGEIDNSIIKDKINRLHHLNKFKLNLMPEFVPSKEEE